MSLTEKSLAVLLPDGGGGGVGSVAAGDVVADNVALAGMSNPSLQPAIATANSGVMPADGRRAAAFNLCVRLSVRVS